jgi:uncharacterized membrane protein
MARRRGDPRTRLRRLRNAAYGLVLLALLPKTAWIFHQHSLGAYRVVRDTHYIPRSDVEAFKWLRANTDWRAVIWASGSRGNVIPFMTGNRVFIGHNRETVDYARKDLWTMRAFLCHLSVDEMREIIDRYGVDYLYETTREKYPLKPRGAVEVTYREILGEPVYRNQEVRIYRTRRGRESP